MEITPNLVALRVIAEPDFSPLDCSLDMRTQTNGEKHGAQNINPALIRQQRWQDREGKHVEPQGDPASAGQVS